MNRILLLFLVFPLPGLLAAQDLPQPAVTADTVSLLYALKKGSIQGHARLFSMATDNTGALSDYAATAIGGGIRYKSAGFHGFSIGLGGYFIYKLASSDLSKPDPLTNAANRYEIGLFDIQQAKNKSDMNRLEELFLQYQHQSLTVTVGKQLPEMPFINQQDGRMRATGIDGLLLKWKTGKTGSLQAAYLWQISPRSTVRWFSIGESIGVYPMGQTVSGKPGDYQHNLQSKGVLITGWEQKIKKALTLQLWNQFTENIFNTALLQTDLRLPLQPQTAFTAGFQLIRQDALHDGGNLDPAKTYFEKGGKSWVLGGSAGMDYHNWNAS
ncbi:OprD family outer membrane porin, partial [Flavihumibacter sp. CACIAM 22H1]|uniref:OprD family outer membrane porin n=1 Tax=Flavihumibacter sp. CACIAM 22H1 TaxID=1812911 RepID=UPI0025C2BDE9